ncbi:MAG: hypothetical protein ACR2OO_09030 [Thermomicrobiales bacterium]
MRHCSGSAIDTPVTGVPSGTSCIPTIIWACNVQYTSRSITSRFSAPYEPPRNCGIVYPAQASKRSGGCSGFAARHSAKSA